jgi:molybdopterin converting factor small subunit
MKVAVRFFSRLKDITGCETCSVELPDGARVAELLTSLYGRFNGLAAWHGHILTAVDLEYIARDTVLHHGVTVEIMPPVQGG